MITSMLGLMPVLLAQTSNGGSAAAGGAAAAGLGLFVLFFWGLGLIALVFTIWMLIDCLTSSLPSTEKLIWVVVILLLNGLGALLYFFLARGKSRAAT